MTNNVQGGRATITPDPGLTADWAGQDVRVEIARTGSHGKVLAVPVAAVSLDGAGNPSVTVADDDRQRVVEVAVGATGDGYVQITPTETGAIREDDRVVVGVG